MNLIGEVEGKNVVIVDDLISTGGSLIDAASTLKEHGALAGTQLVHHGMSTANVYSRMAPIGPARNSKSPLFCE